MYQCHKYGFKLSTTEFNRVLILLSLIVLSPKIEISFYEIKFYHKLLGYNMDVNVHGYNNPGNILTSTLF